MDQLIDLYLLSLQEQRIITYYPLYINIYIFILYYLLIMRQPCLLLVSIQFNYLVSLINLDVFLPHHQLSIYHIKSNHQLPHLLDFMLFHLVYLHRKIWWLSFWEGLWVLFQVQGNTHIFITIRIQYYISIELRWELWVNFQL